MRCWLRTCEVVGRILYWEKMRGLVHVCNHLSLTGMRSNGPNTAKSEKVSSLLEWEGSCLPYQRHPGAAQEACMALHTRCVLSVQPPPAQRWPQPLSVPAPAFLREERLPAALLVVGGWVRKLYYLPPPAHQESMPFLSRQICSCCCLIIMGCPARSTGPQCPSAFHCCMQSRSLMLLWTGCYYSRCTDWSAE